MPSQDIGAVTLIINDVRTLLLEKGILTSFEEVYQYFIDNDLPLTKKDVKQIVKYFIALKNERFN